MPFVSFYPSEQYFHDRAEAEGVDLEDGGVVTSGFVSSNGWVSKKQSLFEAEQEYSAGIPHDPNYWSEIGLTEYQVYEEDDPSQHIDAWKPFNAGTSNEQVSSTNTHGENSIFKGGFIGVCPEEQAWQWDDQNSQWRCDGAVDWEQAVLLPDISGDTIGMMVMPYNAMTDKTDFPEFLYNVEDGVQVGLGWESYATAYSDADHLSGSDELLELNAKCWPGGVEDRPESGVEGEDYIFDSVSVQTSNPFGIYGEIDTSSVGQYSCYWNYTTSNHGFNDALQDTGSEPINIYEDMRTLSDPGMLFRNEYGLQLRYEADEFANQIEEWR